MKLQGVTPHYIRENRLDVTPMTVCEFLLGITAALICGAEKYYKCVSHKEY